jgi:hypothetical protein
MASFWYPPIRREAVPPFATHLSVRPSSVETLHYVVGLRDLSQPSTDSKTVVQGRGEPASSMEAHFLDSGLFNRLDGGDTNQMG